MKRIGILILFLAVFMTGCSYEVSAGNSQKLHGENEDWKADYQVDFSTHYPQKDGEVYAKRFEQKRITVAYKNDLVDLSAVKHLEISYQDSFGESGSLAEDFDSPPKNKEFHLGGGGSEESGELGDYFMPTDKIHKTILIFSGPSADMRANAAATVTIRLDGKTETIQLSPVDDAFPQRTAFMEQVNHKLSKKPFLRFFSGRASDLPLTLEAVKIRIATDKSISGATIVTEGDKKGQELVPTVLYYEFTIKNEGRKSIIAVPNDLEVKLVPGDHLQEISKETAGTDIFDPDLGYGSGQSIEGDIFRPGEESKILLSFDLCREYPPGTMSAPSEANQKKLLDHAADASLIVIYKNQEAAHFELKGN